MAARLGRGGDGGRKAGGSARSDVCYAAARDVAQLVFGLEFELSLGCGSGSGCLPACLMLGIFVGQKQQQQRLHQNRQQAKRAQQNMQLQEEPQQQQQQPSSSSQATTATTVATMASALGRVVIPSSYVLVDLLVFFVVVFFGVDPLALAICQLFGKLTAQRSLQCTHTHTLTRINTHTQRQSHMHCTVAHSCKLMSLLVLQLSLLRCSLCSIACCCFSAASPNVAKHLNMPLFGFPAQMSLSWPKLAASCFCCCCCPSFVAFHDNLWHASCCSLPLLLLLLLFIFMRPAKAKFVSGYDAKLFEMPQKQMRI